MAFTWREFVQRNNSELVAGWGNLVNRTATMIHKNFGEIPSPATLEPVDEEVLAAVATAFDTVGDLLARQRLRAGITEAMRAVSEVNAYISRTEPFKLKGDDQRERLATILHTLAQCVSDLNTILAPFLPHAANRVHLVLGGEGQFVPMPQVREVPDLDVDGSYPVITGEYSDTPPWATRPVVVGTPIDKPVPVFVKLDEAIIAEELGQNEG